VCYISALYLLYYNGWALGAKVVSKVTKLFVMVNCTYCLYYICTVYKYGIYRSHCPLVLYKEVEILPVLVNSVLTTCAGPVRLDMISIISHNIIMLK